MTEPTSPITSPGSTIESSAPSTPRTGVFAAFLHFCILHKPVVAVMVTALVAWGVLVAPFNWALSGVERDPVPVDAIPDLGENQQIVFAEWPGRSPQDIDDQVSYPLTVALLGLPGVKDVRSYSIFGFSTIYVIFEDGIDFYWSRSRILEKLNSLPPGTLPPDVQPALGPDATALGQVFWYTLEGRDPEGRPTGGWNLQELRSIQDFNVRYRLAGVEGVAEVASVGGFVLEYQVDVDPDAMRAADIALTDVLRAVRRSNVDVSARTLEVNRAEYVIRGVGRIESLADLEVIPVAMRGDTPILLRDIAVVSHGPALRRGALTKAGVEAVGGVVVVRYGENPMAVIDRVKREIETISAGLPSKVLEDGTLSRVAIVPFYDRTQLINETLGTLESAIAQQILVTLAVVVLMVMHLRSSLLISSLLPLTVLMTFIGMKVFGVDANLVALAGIAIAVGTVVDMGIVLTENIMKRLDEAPPTASRSRVILDAATEVGSAVLTAVLTTVVSFLPVFTMEASEGKLFRPLAWTKTIALLSSIFIALVILPPLAHLLLRTRHERPSGLARWLGGAMLIGAGVGLGIEFASPWIGIALGAFGGWVILAPRLPRPLRLTIERTVNVAAVAGVLVGLAAVWEPLGPDAGSTRNLMFVVLAIAGVIGAMLLFRVFYAYIINWCLRHKIIAMLPSLLVVIAGLTIWLGFDRVWGWLPEHLRRDERVVALAHAVPGLGREFMPALDEGSFLYMPTTMVHASIGEALDLLKMLDRAIMSVPEVELAVGKIGRVESPLDPAPVSMVETIIEYKSEYIIDEHGRRMYFQFDPASGEFVRDASGDLVADEDGRPYRQWRPEIKSPDDIWSAIVEAATIPGVTSAPRLQPIETRLVMLQSGFRAQFGIKVFGPDLETIERFSIALEQELKKVPVIEPTSVFADRIVGKPYLEIELDRERLARYGLSIADVQEVIEVAIGGRPLTVTVEGRERYPVRVRYARERRDDVESLGLILIPTMDGRQIPLQEVADLVYRRGPQMIKSEHASLVAYVLFDTRPGVAEIEAVEQARAYLDDRIRGNELEVPAGVSYEFAGAWEQQVRATQRLRIVLPISLAFIFALLYLQFRRVSTTLIVFIGVFIAWGGGFLMLWLYGQPWFLDFTLLGEDMRTLFQVQPFNLSVAVWVGFLALFGIATDDGVIMATRIDQSTQERRPDSIEAIRATVVDGAKRRVRAALMTSATTILALLPILTSTGRGSDLMIPMAIPSFGGMTVALLTLIATPVLLCAWMEFRFRTRRLWPE